MEKFSFSGHESFQCKTQWLKKGYDFVCEQNNFNDPDAVVKLGVGKNMVTAIRFWLKAFGIVNNEQQLTELGKYIFDNNEGKDPYTEDIATLWLLHYMLVQNNIASIYKLTFVDFHKEKNEFTRDHLQNYLKRRCLDAGWQSLYNENTVKKDIGALLQNYVEPVNNVFEDYSVLLLELKLISRLDNKNYIFNSTSHSKIEPEIFLFTILIDKDSNSVSFDLLLELSLIFCLTSNDLIDLIEDICKLYPFDIVFSDIAGIKQLQFKKDILPFEVLNRYYSK